MTTWICAEFQTSYSYDDMEVGVILVSTNKSSSTVDSDSNDHLEVPIGYRDDFRASVDPNLKLVNFLRGSSWFGHAILYCAYIQEPLELIYLRKC